MAGARGVSAPAESPRVTLSISNGLAVITLTRPEAGNALDGQAGLELRQAALACSGSEVRAVLLKAEGRNFCFGGDLAHIARQKDRGSSVRDMTIDFHAAIALLGQMNAPVICAVRGAASGAGLSLAAISDYVIASSEAQFSYAYTGVGFSADGGLTWTLPRLIGLRSFQALYLTGRRVKATEALALGIVSEVVPDETLDDRALAFASEIAAGPTLAFGAVKRLAAEGLTQSLAAHLDAESRALAVLADTEDAGQAIGALLARKSPNFIGR
jgi:2-(1,2-epoxy-1,2-dihydrophenyl)acetyl-CoA isomerase